MNLRSIETAMNFVPDTIFFIKDRSRQYVSCNQELARMCGASKVEDVVGRKTQDFFSVDLVSRYDNLDHDIHAGLTFVDRFDFLHDSKNRPVWTLYSRMPVDLDESASAIMGISRRLPHFRNSDRVYQRLYLATEMIAEQFDQVLIMQDLAERCGCSVSQLQRDFQRVLSSTPMAYQSKLRLQYAKDMLRTAQPLTDIAIDCGFSEQSALSRFFKKQTHMTLSAYRERANRDSV